MGHNPPPRSHRKKPANHDRAAESTTEAKSAAENETELMARRIGPLAT